MTESIGEIVETGKHGDEVTLTLLLFPDEQSDPLQIWEWRIGEKVKVIGNENGERDYRGN